MDKKYTFCRICEGSCGFVAEIENNKIVKYYGDKDHPVSKGYTCIKGRSYLDIQYHPKRIRYPLKKVNGKFERISWDQAIDEIGSKLLELKNKYGGNSIGAYLGNPIAFSYSCAMYSAAFSRFIGSRNTYTAGSQDCNNKFAHSKRFFGASITIIVPDFDNIDYFLGLGTNPAASHFSFVVFPRPMQRLKAMEKRGCKIMWINPRNMESAKQVGQHQFIRPNTDIFLMFGMINYVLENNLEDKEFINKYSKGIDELRKVAKEFGGNLDKVAQITGISKQIIIQITKDFLEATKKGGASVYGRAGTDRGSFATLLAWAIDVFNFITGNVDKKGNFYSTGLVDTQGVAKAGGMTSSNKPKKPEALSRIGKFQSVIGSYPAAIMADEIFTPGKGQIKAMFIVSGDPLVSCPNTKRLEKAYKNLELLVCMDYFINDTGTLADYFLPCKTFLERDDMALATTSFNPIPFACYSDAIVEPEGECKGEWEIFNLLQEKMGLLSLGGPPIKVFKMALKKHDRNTIKQLVKTEKGMFMNEEKKIKYNILLPDNISFEDKLIPLIPEDYISEFEKLRYFNFEHDKKYPYSLISGRQIETINSWIKTKLDMNYCHLNIEDAKKLGIEDYQTIKVSTPINSIEIQAKTTPDLMKGVIWIPHGWGRTNQDAPDIAVEKHGVNVNIITDDKWQNLETFAGMVLLDGIQVNIEKV